MTRLARVWIECNACDWSREMTRGRLWWWNKPFIRWHHQRTGHATLTIREDWSWT